MLVATADLSVERTRDGKTIYRNTATGSGVHGPPGLVDVLRFFRAPAVVRDVLPSLKGLANPRVLDWLLDQHLLFKTKQKDLRARGLVDSVDSPIGRTVSTFSEIERSRAKTSFAVIGAPVDIGASNDGGAKSGPGLVRARVPANDVLTRDGSSAESKHDGHDGALSEVHDLDLRRTVSMAEVDVLDVGDVEYVVGESIKQFGNRLAHVVRRVMDLKYRPLVIGGDHSITRFVLRPFIEGDTDFGIIHFDAHSDLFACGEGVVCHANPFTEVLASPRCKALYQIGLRQFLSTDGRGMRDPRIQYVSARDVWRSTSPEQVFARLPRGIPYYLTFDIDCMDPIVCPQTGTPVTGGLVYYDVVDLFDWITTNLTLLGADFVEVGDADTGENQAAQIAGALLMRFLLSFGTPRELESYAFHLPENALSGRARTTV